MCGNDTIVRTFTANEVSQCNASYTGAFPAVRSSLTLTFDAPDACNDLDANNIEPVVELR